MATITDTTTTNSLNSERSTIINNEAGTLDKDAFLKLLLVELQHQDPTSPMDSDKILTQTSQLSTLEAQSNTTVAMEAIASQFGSTTALSSISAIGKRAVLANDKIALPSEGSINFDIDFNNDVSTGKLEIFDSNNNKVTEFELESSTSGIRSFSWEGLNGDGERAAEGSYSAVASYTDGVSGNFTDSYGTYRVESVQFDGGDASLKLGNRYVPLSEIGEITL